MCASVFAAELRPSQDSKVAARNHVQVRRRDKEVCLRLFSEAWRMNHDRIYGLIKTRGVPLPER
jgi:hypothetical protein